MIKKITMYEASDGTSFPSRWEAETYEERVELYAYVDQNMIEPYPGAHQAEHIAGSALSLWLRDNPRIFIKLMPETESPAMGEDG